MTDLTVCDTAAARAHRQVRNLSWKRDRGLGHATRLRLANVVLGGVADRAQVSSSPRRRHRLGLSLMLRILCAQQRPRVSLAAEGISLLRLAPGKPIVAAEIAHASQERAAAEREGVQ